MGDLQKRMLVRHTSFGTGKVVALEPNAVHVFLPQRGERFAVKLRLPQARAFLGSEEFAPEPWHENVSACTLDTTTGRYGLPTCSTGDSAGRSKPTRCVSAAAWPSSSSG